MKLSYIRGLSADMDDLLSKKGQKEARDFFRYVMWNIRNGYRERASVNVTNTQFVAVRASEFIDSASERSANGKDEGRKQSGSNMRIALVTEYDLVAVEEEEKSGLRNPLLSMIDRFCKRFPGACEIVNLHEFPFAGGCLGCYHCTLNGKCIYKDGFENYLKEHINSADAIVYAFTIKDHSMGHRFKLYDDRQFCNGHRTVTMDKPVGYIVDGDLKAEENLRTLIAARAEVGGNFLAGIATDMEDTDREIDQLAQRLAYAIQYNYTPPKNFYGVGGLKIFRDLIYEMQGMMREDHRFYKEHGFYDFPNKKRGKIAAMYLAGTLLGNPKLMKKSKITMSDGMLKAYRRVIEGAKSSKNTKDIT